MEEVGRLLQELINAQRTTVQRLSDDPQFIDTMLHASMIAIRNHEAGKREALQNAILNTALGLGAADTERSLFLGFIDRFAVAHLRLLDFFDDPNGWAGRNGIDKSRIHSEDVNQLLDVVSPGLSERRDTADQVWVELSAAGLVRVPQLHQTVSSSGVTTRASSALGRRFLEFIRSP